ncbi:MAG: response regulator [Ruminococcus sp.]|nr:response regulator [Ruminococcus sp.]
MKYKVLLNAVTSVLTKDFIHYTEEFFDTLSTSSYFKDVTAHFKFFSPDAYICFVDESHKDALNQMNALKCHDDYNGAPVIAITNADMYETMAEEFMVMPDLVLKRPISPDNIALRVIRFLEELKEKEEQERLKKEQKLREAEEAVREHREQEAAEAAAAAAAAEEVLAEAKKQILIVDDDRSVLKMLKAALEKTYDITAMINGVLVDKILASKRMDLIILDYEMPIETGADIFRRIRDNPKTRDIPICFLTGVAERSKIMEIMQLKPNAYLLKPVDVDMLMATISNIIS